MLLYCSAVCTDDGHGNFYWIVDFPCPSGCQCRPDLYLFCNETNLGRHTFFCEYW
jgi:hypothetical protein